MRDPTITPHYASECDEAGVLGQFARPWSDHGVLGEVRQCTCGRWYRCSSPRWQHWDRLSKRKVKRLRLENDNE